MHLWMWIKCEHEWTDVEDEASASDKHGKLGNWETCTICTVCSVLARGLGVKVKVRVEKQVYTVCTVYSKYI